jgi:peptidoglycan/LPS O-acetylase OafA/YrhL
VTVTNSVTYIGPTSNASETVEFRDRKGRYIELDSIRGIASLIVVFQHFSELFSDPNLTLKTADLLRIPHHASTVIGLFKASPLGVFIRGGAAVTTFFVLSGFVLSLPLGSSKGKVMWWRFVLKRIIRLQLPFIAGLLLSATSCFILARHSVTGMNDWFYSSWQLPIKYWDLFSHSGLINHYDYSSYNKAYWTLAYEMQVSLIFPFLFIASLWLTSLQNLVMALSLTLVGTTSVQLPLNFPPYFLCVLGMFMLGVVLARNRVQLQSSVQMMPVYARTILAVLIIVGYSYSLALGRWSWHSVTLSQLLLALTSAAAILMAIGDGRWNRFLNMRACQFLGRISYSLYLIHLTVLYGLIYISSDYKNQFGPGTYWTTLFLLYLSFSVVISWAFYQLVEKPCTWLSQKVSWRTTSTPK